MLAALRVRVPSGLGCAPSLGLSGPLPAAQDHQLGLDRVRQVTMETDAPAAEVDGWRVGEASDEAPRLVLDTPLPRLTGGPRGPHSVARQAWGGARRIPAVSPPSKEALAASRCEGTASLWRLGSCSGETNPRVLKVAGSLTSSYRVL